MEYPVKGRGQEGLVREQENTNVGEPTYPCTQCGACCKVLHTIETTLPHDETGRCDYLVDAKSPDGRPIYLCSVYETRTEIDCPTLNSVKPADVPWFDFYAFMIRSCGLLQESIGVDSSYKPQMTPDLAATLHSMSEE